MASEQEVPYAVLQHPPAWGLPSACPACLRLRAYLALAAVPHTAVDCPRMPDSELLPALEQGVAVGYTSVGEGPVAFLRERSGIDLDAALQAAEQGELQAYTALLDSTLADALLYCLWKEAANEAAALHPFSAALPWPLSRVIAWQQRQKVKRHLSAGRSQRLQASEVYSGAEKAYSALAARLGEQAQFFAERPSSLDAAVFAHIAWVLHAPLKHNPLKEAIEKHPNLVTFVQRLKDQLFLGEPPVEPPPFSRIPRSAPKAAGQGEASKEAGNKGAALRRRAHFFLLAQAASVVLWVLFSSLSIEMEDADVDDDDDNDGM